MSTSTSTSTSTSPHASPQKRAVGEPIQKNTLNYDKEPRDHKTFDCDLPLAFLASPDKAWQLEVSFRRLAYLFRANKDSELEEGITTLLGYFVDESIWAREDVKSAVAPTDGKPFIYAMIAAYDLTKATKSRAMDVLRQGMRSALLAAYTLVCHWSMTPSQGSIWSDGTIRLAKIVSEINLAMLMDIFSQKEPTPQDLAYAFTMHIVDKRGMVISKEDVLYAFDWVYGPTEMRRLLHGIDYTGSAIFKRMRVDDESLRGCLASFHSLHTSDLIELETARGQYGGHAGLALWIKRLVELGWYDEFKRCGHLKALEG